MAGSSLHRLLWGLPTAGDPVETWPLRPWEIPAVGLPTRVAIYLLQKAREASLPHAWKPEDGPLGWEIEDTAGVFATGRVRQLGLDGKRASATEEGGHKGECVRVEHATHWDVLPHPAFGLPFANRVDSVNPEVYALFCDVLLLLTALDGGERVLDGVAESGEGSWPFSDRWDWRSRIHLPERSWAEIEQVIRWSVATQVVSEGWIEACGKALLRSVEKMLVKGVWVEDFLVERTDLEVGVMSGEEWPRAVRSGVSPDIELPVSVSLDPRKLRESMNVRMGQVTFKINDPVKNGPVVPREEADHVMKQVVTAFQAPNYAEGKSVPDLIVLPELSIPVEEVATLRDHVRATGRASLAGLYWQIAKPVYAAGRSVRVENRWFFNEAEITIPVGYDGRGPTGLRYYRVRKPMPSHLEEGLARALTATHGEAWRVLDGRRWYRFLHEEWGDFTVAICSDLIGAAPWSALRGEMLHLFVVAYNKDVDLYESLTWSRAYENYVNLVVVNNGCYGGSMAWTPKHKPGRELARIRGNGLMVVADVRIPVKELLEEQMRGVEGAIDEAEKRWCGRSAPRSKFKAPPPDYRRRAIKGGTRDIDQDKEKGT